MSTMGRFYPAEVSEPLVVAAAEIGAMLRLGRTRVHMLINDPGLARSDR